MSETLITNHKLYTRGQVLAITISPGPANQFLQGTTYDIRKELFIDAWEQTFIDKLIGCKYKLWLEISKNGLLHWHGVLTVLKPQLTAHSIALLKYTLKDVNVDVDTIDDLDYWIAYCSKDHSIMKTVIAGPLKRTNINDFFKKKEGKRPRGVIKCPPEPSIDPESDTCLTPQPPL